MPFWIPLLELGNTKLNVFLQQMQAYVLEIKEKEPKMKKKMQP